MSNLYCLNHDDQNHLVRLFGLHALKEWSRALTLLDGPGHRLLDILPVQEDVYRIRAACHLRLGQLQEATTAIEVAVGRSQPSRESIDLIERVYEALYQRSLEAYEAQIWPDCVEAARTYRDRYPKDPKACWLLAVGLDETGHPFEALEALETSVAKCPFELNYVRSYGVILRHQNRLDDAIRYCEETLARFQRHGRPYRPLDEMLLAFRDEQAQRAPDSRLSIVQKSATIGVA